MKSVFNSLSGTTGTIRKVTLVALVLAFFGFTAFSANGSYSEIIKAVSGASAVPSQINLPTEVTDNSSEPGLTSYLALSDCTTSSTAQYVCRGGSYTITHGTANCCDANAQLYYINGSTGVGNYGAYDQDQISYSVTAPTGSGGTFTYYTYIYGANGSLYCSSSYVVNVLSGTAGAITAASTSVCPGATVTINNTTAGTVSYTNGSLAYKWYRWSNLSGSWTDLGVTTAAYSGAASTTPGIYYYMRRTYSTSCGESDNNYWDAYSGPVKVNAVATGVSAGSNTAICNGSSATLSGSATAPSSILYFDDFSTNAGWTLGTNWAISSAVASSGCSSNDPASDYSMTPDNRILGYAIGACYAANMSSTLYAFSPIYNLSGYTIVTLSLH